MTDRTHPGTAPARPVPNHHGDHPGFSGPSGLLAAVSFLIGHDDDADLAAELVGLRSDDRLVDIGCGPGVAARGAASRGARVTGIDPAGVMLAVARAVPTRHDVTFRTGSAEAIPVGDGEATVVWSLATVHHWPDLDAGLAEVRRVLEPGGRFLAVERQVAAGATGVARHGWLPGQAAAFAVCCTRAGLTGAAVSDHPGRRRGNLLAVTATRA